jgi:hypothetical protein
MIHVSSLPCTFFALTNDVRTVFIAKIPAQSTLGAERVQRETSLDPRPNFRLRFTMAPTAARNLSTNKSGSTDKKYGGRES